MQRSATRRFAPAVRNGLGDPVPPRLFAYRWPIKGSKLAVTGELLEEEYEYEEEDEGRGTATCYESRRTPRERRSFERLTAWNRPYERTGILRRMDNRSVALMASKGAVAGSGTTMRFSWVAVAVLMLDDVQRGTPAGGSGRCRPRLRCNSRAGRYR